jgi:hypothetical protein
MATTSPNRNIRKTEAEILWGASAGRCNICNTSLLRDDTTGLEVKSGEKAHIVGVADGPRSARSSEKLPRRERNRATNLILLCEKHHTEIDKRPDVYSADYLRELKRRFEERVFFLTSLGKEDRTLVLRLAGQIHGRKVPDLTREQAREVVLAEEGRYPRFDLGATEHDLSIDLRELTQEGGPGYWEEARRQIDRRIEHVNRLRSEGHAGHVSVFALARIPILVMLGNALGDVGDTRVYHRRNQAGWGWDTDAELPRFELINHGGKPTGGVVLACSLSASVRADRVPAELTGLARYEIRPVNDPGPTLLDHPDSLQAFADVYREFLSALEKQAPAATTIHLLPAMQADAAVAIGQIRTPAANPGLHVYDLDKEKDAYIFACEVGR